jgi:hypothetical protein
MILRIWKISLCDSQVILRIIYVFNIDSDLLEMEPISIVGKMSWKLQTTHMITSYVDEAPYPLHISSLTCMSPSFHSCRVVNFQNISSNKA